MYAHSVKRLGINSVNIFINIIPVFTAIFAWYILDEPLTLRKFVGIVIVISGLLLAQVKLRKATERLWQYSRMRGGEEGRDDGDD